MDLEPNPSQNLFPSTKNTFTGVIPIQYSTQQSKSYNNGPFSVIGNRKNSALKNSGKKFVAPVLKSKINDIDFDNFLESQVPSVLSPPSGFSPKQTPKCFQVPTYPDKSGYDSLVSSKNFSIDSTPSLSFMEKLNNVERLVNQSRGIHKTLKDNMFTTSKSCALFEDNSKCSPLPVDTIPGTPKRNKFSNVYPSKQERFEIGVIANSDDECNISIHQPNLQTPNKITLPRIQTSDGNSKSGEQLRSIDEIPHHYRKVFEQFPYFNIIQSKVFDDAFYTDQSLVVCAPTGSGKTVIFELAIVRLLIDNEKNVLSTKQSKKNQFKIVYMAPIKALCSERHEDWSMKFQSLGLSCQELTGDSDVDDFWQLQKADIILTTPEKWDSMTRRWRDNSSLVRQVKLFLIDEVHLLNDESRGATMEAVVSRMKTVQVSLNGSDDKVGGCFRFVAVSATIPNTEDIAEWLGFRENPALAFSMDDSYRPVTLRKVVLGYPWSSNGSEFKFDISLNYKLGNVIQTYSENKPSLVFCSTRKSVEQAASTLAKDLAFVIDGRHKQKLVQTANLVRNHRLRDLLLKGIGYHHAGLDSHDRHLTEELFTQGELLVLVSTSTLAMGVNLPAHLVVVKSTSHYVKGMFQEYSQSEILQMIGRAGRPQFDTSATAVIMTRNQSRNLYLNLVNGTQKIESSLHKHLIEHLNAEIVLSTIHDVTIALEWIRSTFLYIRLLKNPTHYGYPRNLSKEEAEKSLHELCMKNLDSLTAISLVTMDNELRLLPSEPGRLMARYSIAFETMKKFSNLTGQENLPELIEILSSIHEFQDIVLRMNERSSLNKMNKDSNRVTVRYPLSGKIKTTPMKVNCLLQATFGCMSIQDFTLTQDVNKIFRNATRVMLCLVGLQMLRDHFKLLYNAVLLTKCIKAKLWEHSRFVTKQLPSIGTTLSNALSNAGICSFEKLEATDPREIELILNRHPPFGNHLREAVKCLPKYAVHVEQGKRYQADKCDITVTVVLNNPDNLKEKKTAGAKHCCFLLIGDSDNRALLKQRLSDAQLLSCDQCSWQRTLTVSRAAKGDELSVNLISQEWVGLDVESTYTPFYLGPRRVIATSSGTRTDNGSKESKYFEKKKKKPCRHNCINKMTCAHECCKISPGESTPARGDTTLNRKQPQQNILKSSAEDLKRFKYKAVRDSPQMSERANQVVPSTPSLQRSKGWEHLDSFCEYQQTQDGVDDNEMLKSLNDFEREQSYYDEQINIGSRIKHSTDNGGAVKRSAEQLWTEDAPTQVGVVTYEDDLAIIRPRPTKYGFRKENDDVNLNKEQSGNRMGKVFAWKSVPASKSSLFSSATECTTNPSSNQYNTATQSNQMQTQPKLSSLPQDKFACGFLNSTASHCSKRFRPLPTSQRNEASHIDVQRNSTSMSNLHYNTKPAVNSQQAVLRNKAQPITHSFNYAQLQSMPASINSVKSTYLSNTQCESVLRNSQRSAAFNEQSSYSFNNTQNSGKMLKRSPANYCFPKNDALQNLSESEFFSAAASQKSCQIPSLKNDYMNLRRPDMKKQNNSNKQMSLKQEPLSKRLTFDDQLWEEAPSMKYPPRCANVNKKVAFANTQTTRPTPIDVDEEEISISCDFSLEDYDEDEIMMEACLEMEKHEVPFQAINTGESKTRIPSMDNKFTLTTTSQCSVPTSTSQSLTRNNINQFYKGQSQSVVSSNKAADIADARKMFDSIFDGIF